MKKLSIKNLTNRQKKFLTFALACGFIVPANYSSASQTEYVYHDGKEMIQMEFFGEGEFSSEYTLDSALIDATKSSTAYWTNILGPRSGYSSAWQILVTAKKNFQNAAAASYSFVDNKSTERNFVSAMLQGNRTLVNLDLKSFINAEGKDADEKIENTVPDGIVGLSLIRIGQHFGANRDGVIDGWAVDTDTVLPTNEQATDFVGTFRHELGHALGIALGMNIIDADGNVLDDIEDDEEVKRLAKNTDGTLRSKFADDVTSSYSWNMHLVDENLNPAKPGMRIVTPETFAELQEQNPEINQNDYFIVSRYSNEENPASGYAYFIGNKVTEVLDGATFNGVSGLPVNGWEYNDEVGVRMFEGSHFQTPGMMSHRPYSNYTGFLEVELAAMQDLNYDFDRKAYYGKSVYGNDLTIDNTQGYSKRSEGGTYYLNNSYSQVPLGVGLHVFGARNNVTQSANILTEGTGAVGIRVDGYENTINVPTSTEIHSDGYRGKGILIAYGRTQTLNQSGTVTASGQGGNAIEFNFGSSSNGALDEYRGSYIRYSREVDELTGNIIGASNYDITISSNNEYNYTGDELKGALIDNYNLSGTVTGGENAIYIGKNALVKNINVNEGAQINGNIKSDWKNFSESDGIYSEEKTVTYKLKTKDDDGNETEKEETGNIEPLKIRYNDSEYVYTDYIPDLVTALNFNTDFNYSGNISGAENMKIFVNSGTMIYSGSADVLNVTVANGASLFGGTYNLNDMSGKIAEGFSDDTTGKFINHGTIGAASADTILTINGDFVSDGTIQAIGGGSGGYIQVSGDSDIDSSVVTVKNALPNETTLVLTSNSITGTATAYDEERTVEVSALMNATGKIDGDRLIVTTNPANNIGSLSGDETESLIAVSNMNENLTNSGDSRVNELRTIYNLDSEDAKKSLNEMTSEDSLNTLNLAQKSTVVDKVISDRLNKAFAMSTIEIPINPAHFADDDGDEKTLVKAEIEVPAHIREENNAWVSFGKNWGSLRGDVDYHGQTVSGGWDKAFGRNWRGGVFVSYGTMSYGATNSHANIYDTRAGIYSGWRKGADSAYIYADVGWLRNSLRRGLPTLGLSTDANYSSHIYEIGGEYRHDLQPKRTWHIMPYVNLQASYLRQSRYSERGAGIYNQHVNSKHNNYVTGQLGFEFKRNLKSGSYGLRLGVKRGLVGATPKLNFSYEGDSLNRYTIRSNQDKTHGIIALKADTGLTHNWFLGCDAAYQRGNHDKDVSASITIRRIW